MATERIDGTAGGEGLVVRLADTLFMEMFPDAALAPLFRGVASEDAVAQLRGLLREVLAGDAGGGPAGSSPDTATVIGDRPLPPCPLLTIPPLAARQRMRVASILVDCLLEARVAPETVLTALDRLHALLTAPATGSARPRSAGAERQQGAGASA